MRHSPFARIRLREPAMLARFGLLAAAAGLAAGCSSDAIRLAGPAFTGSTTNQQAIIGDVGGRTPQDHIYQNLEVFVEMTLLEWNSTAAAKALYWPFNATFGTGPVIGSLASTIAFPQLILTAVANTPAAGVTNETVYTFPDVQLQEGFPMRILLAPALRDIVLRLRVYPSTTQPNVFFTVA